MFSLDSDPAIVSELCEWTFTRYEEYLNPDSMELFKPFFFLQNTEQN